MKTKYIILIIVVLVVVPVATNYICLSTVSSPVIGDGVTWLSFFGSYLGGVITALITLYVLYRTMKTDKYKKEYEIQQEFFNLFCKDLAELSTVLNIEEFVYILIQLKTLDKDEADKAVSKAIDYGNRIKTQYNTFFLKYGHIPSEAKNEYVKEFLEMENFVSKQIDTIIQYAGEIIGLQEEGDATITQSRKEELRNKVNVLCYDFEKKSEEKVQDIFSFAKRWKKEAWDKLIEIENKYLKS